MSVFIKNINSRTVFGVHGIQTVILESIGKFKNGLQHGLSVLMTMVVTKENIWEDGKKKE